MNPHRSSSASPSTPLHRPPSRIPLASARLRKNSTAISDLDGRDRERASTVNAESKHGDHYQEAETDSGTYNAATQAEEESDVGDNVVEEPERLVLQTPPAENSGPKEEEEEVVEQSPSRCLFTANCNTGSRDYRKVISHIFGRNKKCTTQIPEACWIVYCRKHYQRTRYRTNKASAKQYFQVQFDLINRQLTRMERWGGVISFTIGLRKKERDLLNAEDRQIAQLRVSRASVDNEAVARIHRCKERFMLAYTGENKSWAETRRVIGAIEAEVTRLGMTELPGFELLPDIDPQVHPPVGVRKAANNTSAQSSGVQSSKQIKSSSNTARARSSSGASKRRRLVQGTRRRKDSEDSVRSEDEKIKSPAAIPNVSQSPVPGSLIDGNQKLDAKPEKKNSNTHHTTETLLEQGWYPKEEHLKTPPSRSQTPKTPNVHSGGLRKEASSRLAGAQYPVNDFHQTSSPQPSPSINEDLDKESVHSSTSRTTSRGYDPWPNSLSGKDNFRPFKPSATVSEPRTSKATAILKQRTKRPASALAPADTSSLDQSRRTKKARVTEPIASKTFRAGSAEVNSSPGDVAYRPATPVTPPHGNLESASSSTRLPEMRKLLTPKAPRSAAPQSVRSTASDRTPTPQISRPRSPHANKPLTSQGSRSLSPLQLPSSPISLPRHSSPRRHKSISPVSKRHIFQNSLKEEDNEVEAI